MLVIEDDPDISSLLDTHLSAAGMMVEHAIDGVAGLTRAQSGRYHLIVLDLTLPGLDGIDLCRRLRVADDTTPVLMLSARGDEIDRVLGLEMGVDDYLTKPFGVREFLARVKALLRRAGLPADSHSPATRQVIQIGSLRIDCDRREVRRGDSAIELTAREFDLLCCFARHPGRVFSRNQLLDQVWGYGHDGYEHTVNSHINRLRAKLEADPSRPAFIKTVWGVGYKFGLQSPAALRC